MLGGARIAAAYVDDYCENGPNAEAVRTAHRSWEHRAPEPGRDWGGEIA